LIHVYLAHRLTAPTRAQIDANIEAAGHLMAELADRIPIMPAGSWMTLTRYWDESKREKGLAIDREQISRVDEFWMLGPEISSGMRFEAECAEKFRKPIFDLTRMSVNEIEKWWELGGARQDVVLAPRLPKL
jgi:hypothetical protein